MTLASDIGSPSLQIAGVVLLETQVPLTLSRVRDALDVRVAQLARFRQRLVSVAPGLGRPIWMDDPTFDIRRHVRQARCPDPGDEEALLGMASRVATEPLPDDRPLWSATVVDGLTGGRTALIVTFHHVLTDGVGGLAVLAHLMDHPPGTGEEPDTGFPHTPPTPVQLMTDAVGSRLRALLAAPKAVREIRTALAQLRLVATTRRSPASLSRAIGTRRQFAVASCKLVDIRATAHSRDATVNDALLCAATGALHALLLHRGEDADSLTISIPVSARRTDSTAHLGNQVGSVPVALPTKGPSRLEAIARITRRHKAVARGVSSVLLAPLFRLLAALNLLGWIIRRQRLVVSSVTYLHGPPAPLYFLGAQVADIVPITAIKGNMTVSFVALSYRDTLLVTVIADSDRCPDLPVLVAALQRELDALAHGG
ncbi:acyltransferase, WS/DGAT/MGAT [Amycolatopsis marina]|uniref:diacylglycerol O-acyltransferase n=1 Tax=Amycolatopsis marina TaxID=490629 RepID=A0A1I1B3H7_9PSEU|nr:wax ester/triacylglycerol synthase domain-containing protein [Amycolatopsis marina]SFB43258.1 acyltransferase, WS/DGAT/MGAT [Amycolatopsis marina]